MFKYFATAVTLGIAGVVVASLIVWYAASTWTTLSPDWLFAALVLPTLGLVGGFALSDGKEGVSRGWLRALIALAACPICGFSNYLAFIITSRTWFADRIPAEHQALVYQILHPDVLPAFAKNSTSGGSSSTESWMMYLIVGLVLGPVVFWFTSRKR